MGDSKIIESPALIHFITIVALFSGGVLLTSKMSLDAGDLINAVVDSSCINSDTLSPILNSIRSLPGNLKLLSLLLIVKAIAYLKVAPVIVFGFILGALDVKIKVCEPGFLGTHSTHSVTTYHWAKRMFMFSALYIPMIYISYPVESYLTDIDLVKYLFVGINSLVGYHAVFTLNMNKPPKL